MRHLGGPRTHVSASARWRKAAKMRMLQGCEVLLHGLSAKALVVTTHARLQPAGAGLVITLRGHRSAYDKHLGNVGSIQRKAYNCTCSQIKMGPSRQSMSQIYMFLQ